MSEAIPLKPVPRENEIRAKLQVLDMSRQHVCSAQRIIQRLKRELREVGVRVQDFDQVDGDL